MGIRSLGSRKGISYAAVWDKTGTGAMFPYRDWGAVDIYGDRAVCIAGHDNSSNVNTIQYYNTTSTGNATDFGDYVIATRGLSALSGMGSAHRAVAAGGYSDHNDDEIAYFTIPTQGDATDFGDLATGGQWGASNTNGTRGVWSGRAESLDICYITIASAGNASDFGDLTDARGAAPGATSKAYDRGFTLGGHSANGNRIDYITINSTGNATDFGDLLMSVRHGGALSSSSERIVYAGGKNNTSDGLENVIQYISAGNTGNATDFGDLSAQLESITGCSNGTRGLWNGGMNGGRKDVIQYITIGTTGDATDFGDLLTNNSGLAACTGPAS